MNVESRSCLTVVVTGAAGYIGNHLLRRLSELPEVGTIIGIDIKASEFKSEKLVFYNRSILSPLKDIFNQNKVDILVHLAFVVKPSHQRELAAQIDITGTLNILEACLEAGLKHVYYLSSHTVYGAFSDNPIPITEACPVRPLPGFQYSEDKVMAEKTILDFCRAHPEVQATILRACPVIGTNAADSIATVMLQPPFVLRLKGYDPVMQFVHEDDLLDLLMVLIMKPVPGIYNVANDEGLRYSEIAKLASKRILVMPEKLIRPLLGLSWKVHLQSRSPPSGLELIKYPPVISTVALRKATGYRFTHTSKEAITAFLRSRRSGNTVV